MRVCIQFILPLISLCTTLQNARSQPLPPSITNRIDSLFSQWERSSAPDTYEVFADTTSRFIFSGGETGHPFAEEFWPVGNHLHWEKYDTTAKTDQQLAEYTGDYYCPELDCTYHIGLKDHRLLLSNAKYNDSPLTLYGSDHLISDFWWMNHIHILRNAENQIMDFELNGNRVMHLKFAKKAP